MENQRQIGRAALAFAAALTLSACESVPVAAHSAPLDAKFAQLSITQVGFGQTARYVYCEDSACSRPTPKTPIISAAPIAAVKQAAVRDTSRPGTVVEVSFPFNSPRMSKSDRSRLIQAASAHAGAQVEIIARSDYVGPPKGQRKVVAARAKAMRSIVAKQAQGARITERQEVAGPNRVADTEQAKQRNGTVRFNPSIDLPLKGTPK